MLTLGVDTYITEAAAATYFAAFAPDGAPVDEVSLRQATKAIDRHYYGRFKGLPTSVTQPLAFPRDGATTIPAAVAEATAELARMIVDQKYSPYTVPVAAIAETSIKVDGAISRSIKYASTNQVNQLHVIDLFLAPYLLPDVAVGGIAWVDVAYA